MKKSFVIILISLSILISLGFPHDALAFVPPELMAQYSGIAPTIDGYLGSGEWNDTRKHTISLTNTTYNIDAWLYVKHNRTHIHVGLLVWENYTHTIDQFIIAFDEGDDGGSGSGTRDIVLTALQEDLKVCKSDHTLEDGYYNVSFYAKTSEIDFDADCSHENAHSTSSSEIEYWEGLGYVDDHWESEFSIPFVGNDVGTIDVSDLSCNLTDTVGIKLQYYYGPGANNFYYPVGDKYQISKYGNLSFPAPTVESCNSTGEKKDTYNLSEDVYVNGYDFLPSTTYDFYVVDDVEVWTDAMSIPSRISGTDTSVSSDSDGNISPTLIWNDPSTIGEYDIIVDVNGNGLYDAGLDSLDTNDVEVTAGFIIPEFLAFIIVPLFMIVTLVTAISHNRKSSLKLKKL